jgi:hypothetical protein
MPKLLTILPNDESSVCSHSLCRKLSLDKKKNISTIKVDRLMWGVEKSHLDNFLSNRHQMFREVLKPMSPVSFKNNNNDNGSQIHKNKASKSPYLKHMKSLREKELFLLKTGLITDPSSIDDGNLKKEITIQNQLQSIVSTIQLYNYKCKKVANNNNNNINRREKNNTSNSSLWSSDSTLDTNLSTSSLHADTLSYLVANSSNQWWRNDDRADSSNFSVNSGNTACSAGSEYGLLEGELVSLNGDDELISNDSDSIRH